VSGNPFGSSPHSSPIGGYPPVENPTPPVLAIISLICGIVGMVLVLLLVFPSMCCCLLWPVALTLGTPMPLLALITGCIALAQSDPRGKPIALGGVVMGAGCLLLIAGMFLLVLLSPGIQQQMQQMQQMQNPQ